MTRIYLLRHGETVWNLQDNRYCGLTDIPLNETGQRQARLAGQALLNKSISAIYCSPLERSRETARIIGQYLQLAPVIDERLYELNFGRWEGMTKQTIEQEYSKQWEAWLNDPSHCRSGITGDTGAEVSMKYQSFVQEQLERHRNESILIVGHNTANRLFIAGTLGLPYSKYRSLSQNNCGISILDEQNGKTVWTTINETAHLREAVTAAGEQDEP